MSSCVSEVFEFVLDMSVRQEDKLPYQVLKNALHDPKISEIILVFIGVHHLLEDSVLLLRSLLLDRRPGVILTAKVYSSLATPDLLLYLMADRRLILNPDAHFWFRCSDSLPSVIDDELMMMGMEPCRKSSFRSLDRQRIRELVSEHVNLEDVRDKMVSSDEMAELGLVDGGPIDEVLAKCMGAAL